VNVALPIQTARLTIRRYVESDYDDLLRLQSNPDVVRFLLYDAKDGTQVRESLRQRMAPPPLDSDGQAATWAVVLTETGQHLGEVTFFMVSTRHRMGEIGFVFHPASHGHGYGAEAAVELLRIGFEELKLHRLIGRCDGRNTASAKLMKRIGMRQEAHFVSNEYLKGEWTDELVFAMLEHEWVDLHQIREVGANE
jgi:RimJ/RimL family protein N-acetyltransferase